MGLKNLIKAWLIPNKTIERQFAFGFKCVCKRIDTNKGSIVFKSVSWPETEFEIPVFGPGMDKTNTQPIVPGDECWLDMVRLVKVNIATPVDSN